MSDFKVLYQVIIKIYNKIKFNNEKKKTVVQSSQGPTVNQ